MSIAFNTKVGVLSSRGDISPEFSVALVSGVVLSPLAILHNCLSIHGACHSYGPTEEACGFVHHELMLLALVSSDRFAWMVVGSFTCENLGLELALRELLTHLVVVMRCVDI